MFKLHSEFKPTGDQPQAIDYLVKGINEGKKFQTLLGVTGETGDIFEKNSCWENYVMLRKSSVNGKNS